MHGTDRIVTALPSRQIVAELIDGDDVLKRGPLCQVNQFKQLIELTVQPGRLGDEDGINLIGSDGSQQGMVARSRLSRVLGGSDVIVGEDPGDSKAHGTGVRLHSRIWISTFSEIPDVSLESLA
jgi:hypothetical protein